MITLFNSLTDIVGINIACSFIRRIVGHIIISSEKRSAFVRFPPAWWPDMCSSLNIPLITLDIVQWTLCSCALCNVHCAQFPEYPSNALQCGSNCALILQRTCHNSKNTNAHQSTTHTIQYPIFNDRYWNCIILDGPEFHWFFRHDHRRLKPAIAEVQVKLFHIAICIFLHWWLTRLDTLMKSVCL